MGVLGRGLQREERWLDRDHRPSMFRARPVRSFPPLRASRPCIIINPFISIVLRHHLILIFNELMQCIFRLAFIPSDWLGGMSYLRRFLFPLCG